MNVLHKEMFKTQCATSQSIRTISIATKNKPTLDLHFGYTENNF